jgi:hypothetical protein
MADKPKHHQVPIIRIKEVLIHPNADSLEIIPIEGFQAVVRKEEYKVGDLAYYIFPDSIVPEREEYSFLWRDKVIPGEPVPLKYRRIKAIRLRKQWSEGLLMPLASSDRLSGICTLGLAEGQDISDLLEITHYNPPDPEDMKGSNERGPKRHLPKSVKGWMYYIYWIIIGWLGFPNPLQGSNEKGPKHGKPYYDIENQKNYTNVFKEGEKVFITEKVHGCQGKYVYHGKMFASSRNYWKSKNSTCVWRRTLAQNPWIEDWCKNHEGYTLYGEVIPVQGEKFMYGCKQGELKFLVFDILEPDHTWISKKETIENKYFGLKEHWVPVFVKNTFELEPIKKLSEGKSYIDNITTREGIVITSMEEKQIRGLGRCILKLISNQYLEKS